MVKLRPDMKHVDDPDLLEPLWDGPMANQLSGADGKISNAQAKWGRGYWQQDMDQQCYTGVHRTAVSFRCCNCCEPSGKSLLLDGYL